jgi:tripartite-type tricarboxylate transporter receptor subunit TctC
MSRYTRQFAWLCGLACLVLAGAASAQDFPNRPIKVIVPYPAGDLADVIARLLGDEMAKDLGQPVVVENRTGASGMIGLQAVAIAEPDGYTLALGQMGSISVAPLINKWPFKVEEAFVPVANAYTNFMMVVGTPTLPVKTLPELIAFAKANPGALRFASNGVGGYPHLAMELLAKQAGFTFTHVPYRGATQVFPDLVAGRVEVTLFGFTNLYPYVQDGRLVGIAVTGRQRSESLPKVGIANEVLPGYEAMGWFGYFAPKGTPAAAITKVNAAINRALAQPAIKDQARRLGLEAAFGSPADFGKTWKADNEKYAAIIRELGLDANK